MSNDGTGLRERLQHYADYGYHIKHGEEWGTFIPKVGSGNFWITLTKAIAALSAVAPPVATAERIADSLMMDAVTDKWSGRDAIVAAVRKALAASPAAPAQPEGGDAVNTDLAEWLREKLHKLSVDYRHPRLANDLRMVCSCLAPLYTRPAPAQQAVTVHIADSFIVEFNKLNRQEPHRLFPDDCEVVMTALTAALTSTAAASAADAQGGSDA